MLTTLSRLKYLVTKGALVRKGQMIRANFSKFSQTPQGMLLIFISDWRRQASLKLMLRGIDRIFVAVLYTSDVDKVMRYTDEGASASR